MVAAYRYLSAALLPSPDTGTPHAATHDPQLLALLREHTGADAMDAALAGAAGRAAAHGMPGFGPRCQPTGSAIRWNRPRSSGSSTS